MKTPSSCARNLVHVTGRLTAGPDSGDIGPVGEHSVVGMAFSAVAVSVVAVDVKRALCSSGSSIVDFAPPSEVISDDVLRISLFTSAIKHERGPPFCASASSASALDPRALSLDLSVCC